MSQVKREKGYEIHTWKKACEEVAWKRRVKKSKGTKREFCYMYNNNGNIKSDHDINDSKDNSEYSGI